MVALCYGRLFSPGGAMGGLQSVIGAFSGLTHSLCKRFVRKHNYFGMLKRIYQLRQTGFKLRCWSQTANKREHSCTRF